MQEHKIQEEKRENYFKDLRNQLHHTSKSDIQSAQDISEKHRINPNQNNVINRYLAISLVKLITQKHTIKISIHKNDKINSNITAKECVNNQLAWLKSLQCIHFINVVNSKLTSNKVIKSVHITSLGKKYVKNYIPRYKQISRYLQYGKKSMHNSENNHINSGHTVKSELISFIPILIMDIFTNFLVNSIGNPSASPFHLLLDIEIKMSSFMNVTTVIMGLIVLMNIIIYICSRPKYKSYRNENISKDIHRATRESFVKFLENNRIREPNYRFSHRRGLPKISYYLFNNKK